MKEITPAPIHTSTNFTYTGNNSAICLTCTNILNCPVEFRCGHYSCASCLVREVQASPTLKCAVCKSIHPLNPSSVRAVSPLALQLLRDVKVSCQNCGVTVRLENIDQHLHSGCSSYAEITVDELLQQPSCSPLTQIEQKVASNVLRRHLQQSGGKPFEVQTGGRVRYIHVDTVMDRIVIRNTLICSGNHSCKADISAGQQRGVLEQDPAPPCPGDGGVSC